MKLLRTILAIAIAILLFGCDRNPEGESAAVNPIIGDVSFMAVFGSRPTIATDENLRVSTHLSYVESLLRKRDVSHLSEDLQRKRSNVLDLLRFYRIAGVFPKNFDHAGERVPCFIDVKGTICAVGYLIEQTAGREVAEAINEKFKYSELLSMRDETVDQWIAQSGLTKEECAMIQPTYGWEPDPEPETNDIPRGYALTSSLSTGINLSLSTVNAIQLGAGAKSPVVGIISLGAGAGAIMLGALNLPKEGETQNYRKQTLSIVNIGVGATNLVLGVCNLVSNRPKKRQALVWNLYSFPEPGNESGIGLSLTKKL
jgi:hypothetical protein